MHACMSAVLYHYGRKYKERLHINMKMDRSLHTHIVYSCGAGTMFIHLCSLLWSFFAVLRLMVPAALHTV